MWNSNHYVIREIINAVSYNCSPFSDAFVMVYAQHDFSQYTMGMEETGPLTITETSEATIVVRGKHM